MRKDNLQDFYGCRLIEYDKDKFKLRKGVLTHSFVPVFCGSAFKNKGVQPLLDAVVMYLPSPLDVGDVIGLGKDDKDVVVSPDKSTSFVGLAFKVMNDAFD